MDFLYRYLKQPEWRRQHRWRKAIWSTMSRVGLTGLHALPLNRRWVEIHRRRMPLSGLDESFQGLRIVHISDLHYSPLVWQRYLMQYVRWIEDLRPDLVVVTGDLITGGYTYAHRVATILSHIRATYGVVCTFGNHDYSLYGKNGSEEGVRRADYLEQSLKKRGITVLRNEVRYLQPANGGRPLALVGLDDEWAGQFDANRAFAGLDDNLPIICLTHNPANCPKLLKYPWQWLLAGHTHGRSIATTRVGKRLYGHRYRQYTLGYYAVQGRHLYVNRGLSYGQRTLEWCRPEITLFRLESADASAAASGTAA